MKYIVLCFILTGCAAHPAVMQPVYVNMPVAKSCAPQSTVRPRWNLPQLASTASRTDKLRAALEDLELSKGYIVELEAALAACG